MLNNIYLFVSKSFSVWRSAAVALVKRDIIDGNGNTLQLKLHRLICVR